MRPKPADLIVSSLGPCRVRSPLKRFVREDSRVSLDVDSTVEQSLEPVYFESAGAREMLYFEPARVRAAIVTCGGLCPGINSVIRSMVFELLYNYGVREVLGYRFGYEGMIGTPGLEPVVLDHDAVRSIHRQGGSVLGLSRGKQDLRAMIDTLVRDRVDVLFTIGGDGTLRGAHALSLEIAMRGLPIAVVGVPKTIDNDVPWVDRTFGFDTAVELARLAVDSAHTEATGARNGVGLVKLMGRDAGFIAANAALASREANFCLVPEVPFMLDGPRGLLAALDERLARRGHAVIVVAEGCASALVEKSQSTLDASGNARYNSGRWDVGAQLRDLLAAHIGLRGSVKYIDPSYLIRSGPANAGDSILCDALARNAVHAALAGRTDVAVGRWHRAFTHLPLGLSSASQKRIDPYGELWRSVIEATGQPSLSPDDLVV